MYVILKYFFQIDMEGKMKKLLFLIGIRELGSGWQEYSKDDKINLIHIAVCRLLEPFRYYKFDGYDEDGWPKYKILENLPELKANEQQILMKKAIIQYFIDEDLLEKK